MKVYLVGGAVRDLVMGIEPKDRDYVVVGSTPDEMLSKGFKQVGADFPVFLHPESKEEYALARTERKTGNGYHGFDVNFSKDVTLEEDLLRRDLTINSMAMDVNNGKIIDPYGGLEDIQQCTISATSGAFREDPVRILRVARFAARYPFDVDFDTIDMMRDMVFCGEFDHLTAERVYSEFKKGLMDPHPYRMFRVLEECGALEKLPFWSKVADNYAGGFSSWITFEQRLATMARYIENYLFVENRVSTEIADLAKVADEFEFFIGFKYDKATKEDYMNLFATVDLFRRYERASIALATILRYRGVDVPVKLWSNVFEVKDVDTGSIALGCANKSDIKDAVYNARKTKIVI